MTAVRDYGLVTVASGSKQLKRLWIQDISGGVERSGSGNDRGDSRLYGKRMSEHMNVSDVLFPNVLRQGRHVCQQPYGTPEFAPNLMCEDPYTGWTLVTLAHFCLPPVEQVDIQVPELAERPDR